jgi:hypothetical protein
MTGSSASVEVAQVATASADTIFSLVKDTNNWFRFVAQGSTLFFQSKVGGVKSSATVPYSSVQHRFWRFRHDSTNNLIIWETSSDRRAWHVQHASTAEFDIDAVYVELNAGTYKAVSSPGVAVFDNFQLTQSN